MACEGRTRIVGGHAAGFQALSSHFWILLLPEGRAVAPFPWVGCTDDSSLMNRMWCAGHVKEKNREVG